MNFYELFTDIVLRTYLVLFSIYYTIAKILLTIIFPVAKYFTDTKFESFGIFLDDPDEVTSIQVKDPSKFYTRLPIEGTFGFLEGYLDGDWETRDFYGVISKIFESRRLTEIASPAAWVLKKLNLQTKSKVWDVAKEHYDGANDVIMAMIDKNLQYTCGYWDSSATDLDSCQIAKMNLIGRKLRLKPGMTLLDLGCGYGTLGIYLSKTFSVSVVGCTISKEQVKYGNELSSRLGLDCEFRLCDYRDFGQETGQKFDRIVSIGMLEHVGSRNYREFFQVCSKTLKDDGILLAHCIGKASNTFLSTDEWIHKYIFPNGSLPYYLDLAKAWEDLWVMEDWHNFGYDYYKTLVAWEKKFDVAWPKFEAQYGPRFYKMWKMYLQMSQAAFETRSIHLWQVVLSKDGIRGGYSSPR